MHTSRTVHAWFFWNLLCLLLAGSLTGCPKANNLRNKATFPVKVEGEGLNEQQAVRAALQSSVNKVVVQLQDKNFLEENNELIQKRIYKRSSEFVQAMKILKRHRDPRKGLVTMTVRAVVLPKDLWLQLSNLNRIHKPLKGLTLLQRFQQVSWDERIDAKLLAPNMLAFQGRLTRARFLGKPTSTFNGEKVILKYRVGVSLDQKRWKKAAQKLRVLLKSRSLKKVPFSITAARGFGPHFHDAQSLAEKKCLVSGYPMHAAYGLKSRGLLDSVTGMQRCVPFAVFDQVFRKLTKEQQGDPRITLRNKGLGTMYFLPPSYVDHDALQPFRFRRSGVGVTLQLLTKNKVLADDQIVLGPLASNPRCRRRARRCFRAFVTGASLLQQKDAVRLWMTDQVISPPQKQSANLAEMSLYRFEKMISVTFRFELTVKQVQSIQSARLRLNNVKL